MKEKKENVDYKLVQERVMQICVLLEGLRIQECVAVLGGVITNFVGNVNVVVDGFDEIAKEWLCNLSEHLPHKTVSVVDRIAN